MNDITITALAGTDVRSTTTTTGRFVASFRAASTDRRFDRDAQRWIDADTTWFDVSAWGVLGEHVASSVRKGDPVIITGRLKIGSYTSSEGRDVTTVSIDANAVGHSLQFGTSTYARAPRSAASAGDAPQQSQQSVQQDDQPKPTAESWSSSDDLAAAAALEPAETPF